ncbi:hypothetical protein R3P38DRAFT_3508301 [Favolaschia claudopus]|uniref:Uncharacterized protein n=1 Tax=Favolaschia claudopus TaxID=2862362 RepID=A0AAW0BYI6_9AGAR
MVSPASLRESLTRSLVRSSAPTTPDSAPPSMPILPTNSEFVSSASPNSPNSKIEQTTYAAVAAVNDDIALTRSDRPATANNTGDTNRERGARRLHLPPPPTTPSRFMAAADTPPTSLPDPLKVDPTAAIRSRPQTNNPPIRVRPPTYTPHRCHVNTPSSTQFRCYSTRSHTSPYARLPRQTFPKRDTRKEGRKAKHPPHPADVDAPATRRSVSQHPSTPLVKSQSTPRTKRDTHGRKLKHTAAVDNSTSTSTRSLSALDPDPDSALTSIISTAQLSSTSDHPPILRLSPVSVDFSPKSSSRRHESIERRPPSTVLKRPLPNLFSPPSYLE